MVSSDASLLSTQSDKDDDSLTPSHLVATIISMVVQDFCTHADP